MMKQLLALFTKYEAYFGDMATKDVIQFVLWFGKEHDIVTKRAIELANELTKNDDSYYWMILK